MRTGDGATVARMQQDHPETYSKSSCSHPEHMRSPRLASLGRLVEQVTLAQSSKLALKSWVDHTGSFLAPRLQRWRVYSMCATMFRIAMNWASM